MVVFVAALLGCVWIGVARSEAQRKNSPVTTHTATIDHLGRVISLVVQEPHSTCDLQATEPPMSLEEDDDWTTCNCGCDGALCVEGDCSSGDNQKCSKCWLGCCVNSGCPVWGE